MYISVFLLNLMKYSGDPGLGKTAMSKLNYDTKRKNTITIIIGHVIVLI